jgi:hypothetical protein
MMRYEVYRFENGQVRWDSITEDAESANRVAVHCDGFWVDGDGLAHWPIVEAAGVTV